MNFCGWQLRYFEKKVLLSSFHFVVALLRQIENSQYYSIRDFSCKMQTTMYTQELWGVEPEKKPECPRTLLKWERQSIHPYLIPGILTTKRDPKETSTTECVYQDAEKKSHMLPLCQGWFWAWFLWHFESRKNFLIKWQKFNFICRENATILS